MRITQYTTIMNELRICELMEERSIDYQHENISNERLDNPYKIYQMLCDVFQHDKQCEEYLYLLCFNTKYRLLGVFEVSHGTVNMSACSPREVYQKALLCNAVNIIIAHNHPSGDTTPSKNDMDFTKRVSEAGKIIGIELADSIIVGHDTYYSMTEDGLKRNLNDQ